MYNISMLNKISQKGLNVFDEKYNLGESENPDAIILRSASMHDMELPSTLKAIARAGAGTNNIPIDKCSQQGIVVFNTPGANANAVKELVMCGLFLSCRKIIPASQWAQGLKGEGEQVGKLVEKGKSQFAGPEIKGKTLGVIGTGAIGLLVANCAAALGMNVIGINAVPVDENTLASGVRITDDIKEIQKESDFITIHVPLNDSTRGMIDEEFLSECKDGIRILNFARGGIVDNKAIISALKRGKASSYVIDFPDEEVLGVDGIIALPHLGASTPESEENCASMAAEQLKLFLETGSIKNSVNLPNIDTSDMQGTISTVFAKADCADKITASAGAPQKSVTKGDFTYMVFEGDVSEKLAGNDGICKITVINK